MLSSIITNNESLLDIKTLLICFICAIVYGLIIAFTHKVTSKYSKNFLITLTILPFLVGTIIVMVSGNLGTSVAIVGAFSIVRFRSLPGTSKEIASVFFAMTVGLATGVGYVIFASIITLVGCAIILILSKTNIFNHNQYEKILKITIPENLDYTSVFDDVFKEFTKSYTLEQVKTTNMGSLFELNYRINLDKKRNEKEFIDTLRIKNGNLKVMLSHNLEENDL